MKYRKFEGIILVGMLTFLVGCGNTDTASKNVDLPDTIYLNDLSVQYGTIEIPEEFWDARVDFDVNDNNEIRCITIENPVIETYKGIAVGDSINKVKSTFTHEMEMGNQYLVRIAGTEELSQDIDLAEIPEDCIYLQYLVEDETIKKIIVCDYNYARYLR